MRLLPRDEKFFDLFRTVAQLNVDAAKLLEELIAAEPDRRRPIVDAIKRLEHDADEITHDVVGRLDRTFITPLDREDIHMLASHLDEVMDLMDGTARRIQMFHAGSSPSGAGMLADVIRRANEQLLKAVSALEKDRNGAVLEACKQVKALEEEGDSLYHQWVGNLFEGSPDALQVIKWKGIYDNLERTLDQAEDVSNVLESIFIKHA
jgi:uncharacterized protein Yka (UPF0111/DUF47 family)